MLYEVITGEKPLALYLFERDRAVIERVRQSVTAGGIGVNMTLAHFLHLNLPFGGIGHSGLGAAHGEWGFRVV